MKSIVAVLLVSFIVLTGCSNPVTSSDNAVIKVSAAQIDNITFEENKLVVDVYTVTANPCYDAQTPKITTESNGFYIELFVKSRNQPCIAILGSIRHTISLPVERGSTYKLEFFRFNEVPLDTTVTVPLN